MTDQTGALIAGASRAEVTGANGSYTFTLLPPGGYAVKISAAKWTE